MKKMNKKGFTLIELLAVIVVLALIMVLAIPNILDTMNDARKKSFQMYGEKVLKDAMTLYESQHLLGGGPTNKYNSNYCYDFDELKIADNGVYYGWVVLDIAEGNIVKYNLFLTDGTYEYTNVPSEDVMSDLSSIGADTDKINKIKSPGTNDTICE